MIGAIVGLVVGVVIGIVLHVKFGATVDKIDTKAGLIVHEGFNYFRKP